MATSLTIAGTTYEFPESGEDPNWGPNVTDWARGVTDAINTILSPGDILTTQFAIDNNISVPTNINGLLFDSGTVRAANVTYAVYRISNANPSGHAETGVLKLIFDDSAASGMKWKMTQDIDGSSGVAFSIGDNGQFQYVSTNIGTLGYVGTITFSAKSLAK